MTRRDRVRRPARRAPFRDPKPTILVVCEGEVTEPEYLKGFKLHCQNPRVDFVIAKAHGVPKTLVNHAKAQKAAAAKRASREQDDNLAYDSVWVVFDIDEHPLVEEAKQMAAANQIEVAISNPNFELWLLLHFSTCGMQDRSTVVQKLKVHVPDYEKAIRFADFKSGYLMAVERAKALDAAAHADGEHHRNPTTGVYQLTELIRGTE